MTSRVLVVRIVYWTMTGVLVVKLCRINLRSHLVSSSANFFRDLCFTLPIWYILYILYIRCFQNILQITTAETQQPMTNRYEVVHIIHINSSMRWVSSYVEST
jgi:hypothetical protein